MIFFDAELLIKCFILWIFLYSAFIALVEINLSYLLFSVIVYAIVLYVSLTPPNEKVVNNVFGENPRIKLRDSVDVNLITNSELNRTFSIAHNAAVFDFNDNNADAVQLCSRYGCQIIYLDVNVTKDNILLVHRSSKLNSEDESYRVSKSVDQYNYKELLSEKNPNLCTVEEILPIIENLNVKIIFNVIHLAYYKNSKLVVNALLKEFAKRPLLYERAVICSTNLLMLYTIRMYDPSILVALKWTRMMEQPAASISWLKKLRYSNSVKHFIWEHIELCSWWILDNFLYRIIGISAIILPKEIITPNVVENWDSKNVRCIASIVNLSTEKAYYANALGIAFLTDTLLNVN